MGGATINLVFNGIGSNVDFSNSFWSSNQQWQFFDVAGTTSGTPFQIGTISPDIQGDAITDVYSNASFGVSQIGSDVYITYSVPEPSTALFVATALSAALLLFPHKRRSQA